MPEGFFDIGPDVGGETHHDPLGCRSPEHGKGIPVTFTEVVIIGNGKSNGSEGNVSDPVQSEHPDIPAKAGIALHIEGAVLKKEMIGVQFFPFRLRIQGFFVREDNAAFFENGHTDLVHDLFPAAVPFPQYQIIEEGNRRFPYGVGQTGSQFAGGVKNLKAEAIISRSRQPPGSHQQSPTLAQREVFNGAIGIPGNDEPSPVAVPGKFESEFRERRLVLVKLRPADPVDLNELLHSEIGFAFDVRNEPDQPMGFFQS